MNYLVDTFHVPYNFLDKEHKYVHKVLDERLSLYSSYF